MNVMINKPKIESVHIIPPFLKPGDRVGVVAPARKIVFTEIANGLKTLENWGLKVETGKNLFNTCHQYSGTDDERTSDLQTMLDDKSIRAIFCARGGYGTVRVIDKLSFSKFLKEPKWLVGFSDITALHAHINHVLNVESLHAPMLINISSGDISKEALDNLKNTLFGEHLFYKVKSNPFNKPGIVSGKVVGGNLSVLYSLMGSRSEIATDGKILFIEDLDEYLYHIDRMIMCFKRAGKLKNLAGLIVGGMTKMNDNTVPFGKNPNEIIAENVAGFNYPVCFGFPAGHISNNQPLIMGREACLKVSNNVVLDFGS